MPTLLCVIYEFLSQQQPQTADMFVDELSHPRRFISQGLSSGAPASLQDGQTFYCE